MRKPANLSKTLATSLEKWTQSIPELSDLSKEKRRSLAMQLVEITDTFYAAGCEDTMKHFANLHALASIKRPARCNMM